PLFGATTFAGPARSRSGAPVPRESLEPPPAHRRAALRSLVSWMVSFEHEAKERDQKASLHDLGQQLLQQQQHEESGSYASIHAGTTPASARTRDRVPVEDGEETVIRDSIIATSLVAGQLEAAIPRVTRHAAELVSVMLVRAGQWAEKNLRADLADEQVQRGIDGPSSTTTATPSSRRASKRLQLSRALFQRVLPIRELHP
ncbi:unnamed protein product, partial [Amoebophrya sp. A120]